MYKNIQLKFTDSNGIVQLAYPVVKPNFVEFDDGDSLIDKINNIGNAHNHNIATVSNDGFLSKSDKAKLDSLTNYTHPSSHAATMITQDSTHRFVTDVEKNTWNNKASTAIATTSSNGLLSSTDKQKIDKINGIESSLNTIEGRINSVEASIDNMNSIYYEEVIG